MSTGDISGARGASRLIDRLARAAAHASARTPGHPSLMPPEVINDPRSERGPNVDISD
jgi:hypothetical protein